MKEMILLFAVSLSVAVSNCNRSGNNTSTTAQDKPTEDTTAIAQQQAAADALSYLKITGSSVTKNATGKTDPQGNAEFDGWLAQGWVENSSADTRFKNAVIGVAFISKTGEVIKEWEETHYKYYGPGTSKKFSIKVYPPVGTDTFRVSLKSASASE